VRGHAGHLGRVADDVDGQAFLGAGFGEVKTRVVVEDDPQCEGPAPRPGQSGRLFGLPGQPPCPGEMDHQVQAADVEVEELAAPAHPDDLLALQGERRWVVGLEDAHGDRVDAGDVAADGAGFQQGGEGRDLRQFGHRQF